MKIFGQKCLTENWNFLFVLLKRIKILQRFSVFRNNSLLIFLRLQYWAGCDLPSCSALHTVDSGAHKMSKLQ